jgi:hypothetical protein
MSGFQLGSFSKNDYLALQRSHMMLQLGSKLFLNVIPHKINCDALSSSSSSSPILVDMSESVKNTKDAQPGSASDMSIEMLKNMNVQTGMHAAWMVRVLSPKPVNYTFMARQELVRATKFQRILVSKDPKQFMLGSVAFNFADKGTG